jgi:hypothetical protein
LAESHRVLKGRGIVVVATPFMMQSHPSPQDHWRFSESGLAILLEQSGFQNIRTDSWGHKQAVIAHMQWSWYGVRTKRALRQILQRRPDERFPLHCWAIAEKPPDPRTIPPAPPRSDSDE